MANDSRRHAANRARAGDEHVFAQAMKRKSGMDRVAKRIENGLHIARDVAVVHPDIGHWQREIFREGAGAIDADALRVLAEMTPAGKAVSAAAAHDVAFAANNVTDV